jgi:hypothetical protein
MRGRSEFKNLNKQFENVQRSYERNIAGKMFKHNCLRQINAKKNFMHKGFKPLTMKLTGHTDSIRSLD